MPIRATKIRWVSLLITEAGRPPVDNRARGRVFLKQLTSGLRIALMIKFLRPATSRPNRDSDYQSLANFYIGPSANARATVDRLGRVLTSSELLLRLCAAYELSQGCSKRDGVKNSMAATKSLGGKMESVLLLISSWIRWRRLLSGFAGRRSRRT